jgi:1,4-alpha-glucan branching enzyme
MQNNDRVTNRVEWGGAGFGSQWDPKFVHNIRPALITGDDSQRSIFALAEAISHRYSDQAFSRVVYTESHDEDANGKARVPQEIWPGNAGSWASKKRSTLGAALVLTVPGIPMLFQGQEFLEDEYFSDTDPLDWSKTVRFSGITDLYRDLIRLRRNWFNNTRGLKGQNVSVFHANDGDKVVAYHRWEFGGARDDVVIVLNFANRRYDNYIIGLPRQRLWSVRFNSDWNGYSNEFSNHPSFDTEAFFEARDNMPFSGSISIGPYTAIILSQDQ